MGLGGRLTLEAHLEAELFSFGEGSLNAKHLIVAIQRLLQSARFFGCGLRMTYLLSQVQIRDLKESPK